MTAAVRRRRDDAARLLEREGPISDAEFEVIYRRFKATLVTFAYNASDPEAIADLALLDGYRVMNRFEDRNEHTFLAYLKRAARGHMADDYRRRQRVPVPTVEETETADPTDALIDQVWLTELVEQLSPDQKAVIQSRFFDDLDGAQTAALLDKDPNAIYQLQHRALRRLRRIILATALAVVAIVGALILRLALSSDVQVDSSPVDQPSTTTTTAVPATDAIAAETTVPRPGQDGQPDDGPTTTASAPLADTDESAPTPTTDAPEETADSEDAIDSNPQALPTTAAPATTTSAPATEPLVITPPNQCITRSITSELTSFELRLIGDSPILAADFKPPAAIRFLDANSQVLHVIDTSGPMTTGLLPDTHGWLGTGGTTGTSANFEDTPRPTAWGLLAPAQATVGWASIQYELLLDDESVWLDMIGCEGNRR